MLLRAERAARGREGEVQVRGGPLDAEQQAARVHGLVDRHHQRHQVHAPCLRQPPSQVLRQTLVSECTRLPTVASPCLCRGFVIFFFNIH